MAGSLNHVVDPTSGQFRMEHIENLGDAYEALEECFHLILLLTGGKKGRVNKYLRKLNYPTIGHDMKVTP